MHELEHKAQSKMFVGVTLDPEVLGDEKPLAHKSELPSLRSMAMRCKSSHNLSEMEKAVSAEEQGDGRTLGQHACKSLKSMLQDADVENLTYADMEGVCEKENSLTNIEQLVLVARLVIDKRLLHTGVVSEDLLHKISIVRAYERSANINYIARQESVESTPVDEPYSIVSFDRIGKSHVQTIARGSFEDVSSTDLFSLESPRTPLVRDVRTCSTLCNSHHQMTLA